MHVLDGQWRHSPCDSAVESCYSLSRGAPPLCKLLLTSETRSNGLLLQNLPWLLGQRWFFLFLVHAVQLTLFIDLLRPDLGSISTIRVLTPPVSQVCIQEK